MLQRIVAALPLTPLLETLLMTGAVVSAVALVVNVKSPEVAGLPAASTDFTRKWYVALAARPLSPWECAVTSVALSGVEDPYEAVAP